MSIIQSLNETSEKAVDTGEVYLKKTQEYYKLKVFQQLTLTVSMLCKIAIIGVLLFLGFIFFIVSGTIALAEVIDNTSLACIIVGGFLFILSILVYFLRGKIDTAVIKTTAKTFFD